MWIVACPVPRKGVFCGGFKYCHLFLHVFRGSPTHVFVVYFNEWLPMTHTRAHARTEREKEREFHYFAPQVVTFSTITHNSMPQNAQKCKNWAKPPSNRSKSPKMPPKSVQCNKRSQLSTKDPQMSHDRRKRLSPGPETPKQCFRNTY